MEERRQRVISGKVSRGNFSSPKILTSKTGDDTWQSWSCLVEGTFIDTGEKYEGFVNSSYPVAVYDAKTQEIHEDVSGLDRATFEADVMVTEVGEKLYLYAVNVKKLLLPPPPNPFKENPFLSFSGYKTTSTENQLEQLEQTEQMAEYAQDDIPF